MAIDLIIVGFFEIIRELLFGKRKEGRSAPLNPGVEDQTSHVGKTGVAQSDLRPSGTVLLVEGETRILLDCVAQGGYVEKSSRVTIVAQNGPALYVRKLG